LPSNEGKQSQSGKQGNRGPRVWRPAPKTAPDSHSAPLCAPAVAAAAPSVIRLGKPRDSASFHASGGYTSTDGGTPSGLVITVGTSGDGLASREVGAAVSRPQSKKRQHFDAKPDAAVAFSAPTPSVHSDRVVAAAAPPVPHGHGHSHHGSKHATGTQGSGIDRSFLSSQRWTDPDIAAKLSAPSKRALSEAFGFEFMSRIQSETLHHLLCGSDVFAKAKTGGGKTIGFLLPAVERLVATGSVGRRGAFGILVISPTRELALQTLEEARTLTKFHAHMRVHALIGGTNINGERQRLCHSGGVPSADILIVTPGRCVDHISSTTGFADALGQVRTLVLDEADRLLDMGFEPALNEIRRVLPLSSAGRQTLLFSATVPPGVTSVAQKFLKRDAPLIDTVGEDSTATNPQVTQEAMVLPASSVIPALARVLGFIACTQPDHKVIVFFTTARQTGYLASVFEKLSFAAADGRRIALNLVEMHSRKSQSARTSAAERFRTSSGVIMFSSDVSARGMDYPDITHVIQVGITDREQYIHRVGRTARAGKQGCGLLLLADYEVPAILPALSDLPLSFSTGASSITGGVANGLPGHESQRAGSVCGAVAVLPTLGAALAGVARDDELLKESSQAYGAALGFYNSSLKKLGWSKERLVQEMNSLWLTLGCPEVPVMPVDTLGKMHLRGTKGLREGPSLKGHGGRRSGGFGAGGR
jgi:ATP-dependent RNA helicase MSS116, mitochondrial